MRLEQYIRKISILAALLLTAYSPIFGCGIPYTSPSELKLYRLCPNTDEYGDTPFNYRAMENCILWAKQTSEDISLGEIYDVVYEWSIENIEQMVSLIKSNKSDSEICSNGFARWIIDNKDYETLEFLHLAKSCESARFLQNSSWYYPVDGDDVTLSLYEVSEKALAYDKPRFRERYALQSIRAMFATGRFDECVNYWERSESELKDNLLKVMCGEYIAGAYIRLGENEKAAKISIGPQISDITLKIKDRIDRIEMLHKYHPNSNNIELELQKVVRGCEYVMLDGYKEFSKCNINTARRLLALCEKIAAQKPQKGAMWNYTAAYMNMLFGNNKTAYKYIKEAEKEPADECLQSSIKVLAFLLDAKCSTLDQDFEKRLTENLEWMFSRIAEQATEPVDWSCTISWSNYSDNLYCRVISKVLLSELAPRYFAKGDHIKAIQMVNMADNSLINIVGKVSNWSYIPLLDKHRYITLTPETARRTRFVTNEIDYCNSLFVVADTVAVEKLQEYVKRVNDESTPFNQFAKRYSYTDPDYFNEIIGTRLIREYRYKEAVGYLESVSPEFRLTLNTFKRGYMRIDPFTGLNVEQDGNYKLNFAKRMVELEQLIDQERDPNLKADMQIEYLSAMKLSIERLWSLTRYYYGTPVYFITDSMGYEWELTDEHKARLKACDQKIKQILHSYTDPEAAARAYWRLGFTKSAIDRFPNTKVAQEIRSHCDNLRNYNL